MNSFSLSVGVEHVREYTIVFILTYVNEKHMRYNTINKND